MEASNITYALTVNAGSSSIKLGLFEVRGNDRKQLTKTTIQNTDQPLTELLTDWLKQQAPGSQISAIGHRIVHGGSKYFDPCIITDQVISDLRQVVIFDPEHLPIEIELIETCKKLFPGATQVACFDTGFHQHLPTVARLLPIPRKYQAQGLRRYGFHGLSCQFILKELKRLSGPEAKQGRVIIAHLGSGASLTAVLAGESVDTTMGLTPASGVPMSTRSGDLDPGVFLFLAEKEGLSAQQFNTLVNTQSGLLGLSDKTPDMKELLEQEDSDAKIKDAVDLFCYQVKKSIGGLSAALGGLDTLVFTGGMGEDAPKIRTRVCQGLDFVGIMVDENRNAAGQAVISSDSSTVTVRVLHTNEASIIAEETWQLVNKVGKNEVYQ